MVSWDLQASKSCGHIHGKTYIEKIGVTDSLLRGRRTTSLGVQLGSLSSSTPAGVCTRGGAMLARSRGRCRAHLASHVVREARSAWVVLCSAAPGLSDLLPKSRIRVLRWVCGCGLIRLDANQVPPFCRTRLPHRGAGSSVMSQLVGGDGLLAHQSEGRTAFHLATNAYVVLSAASNVEERPTPSLLTTGLYVQFSTSVDAYCISHGCCQSHATCQPPTYPLGTRDLPVELGHSGPIGTQ